VRQESNPLKFFAVSQQSLGILGDYFLPHLAQKIFYDSSVTLRMHAVNPSNG